jgi:hypothetical protein
VQASNPQSPLVLYPRTTVVETRVKSVSPVGRNVAMVRFDTIGATPAARCSRRGLGRGHPLPLIRASR